MNKIFCIVGKSASGKDTIYKEIISNRSSNLIPVIPYTTRPKRIDEKNGIDYNFVTEEQLKLFEKNNQIIEKRQYLTTQGVWSYFTLMFDIDSNNDYILITTLDGALSIIKQYGQEMVHIIYLVVDDKTRLLRCIERESRQVNPDYEEVCRRFIADQKDFANDKIQLFKNIHYIDTKAKMSDCLVEWGKIYASE